ncbi:hypothetical protein K2X05_10470 [bacterium]|nr:hypothetical protein [bacterium]
MFLHFLISISFASSTWLIKAPGADAQEFAVYTQNSTAEKISTYFLKCEVKKDLYEDFKKAQIQFLDGNIDQAKFLFANIAEKKWSCDWANDERKIVYFSLMRLAQLENTDLHRHQLLQDAIDFDDQQKPDESVFPPPLVKEFATLQKKQFQRKITLPAFAKKFSAILRNGRFVSLAQITFEALPGKARYTFVSDSYQVEKAFLTLAELESLSLEPQPLVYGDCENFQITESLRLLKNISVFHGLDCIKDNTPTENLIASASGNAKDVFLSTFASDTEKTQGNGSWIQRNGLWIGSALVSSLLIGYYLNKQNEEPRAVAVPSTTLHQ